tara:strand:- start:528 stop:743 length:216 start_codon:yes stop_codon:yes gene_type:complete
MRLSKTKENEMDKNKLAKNNKREIKEAILTMDKLYWAIDEREENEKDENFIELILYCRQMYKDFKEVLKQY